MGFPSRYTGRMETLDISSVAVFRCLSKACAPPPVGTGGSTKLGHAAHREAVALVSKASEIADSVTKTVGSSVAKGGGLMAGLDHKLKTSHSMQRKIHNKSLERGQDVKESSSTIRDALRFTAVIPTAEYAKSVKSTIKELESQGFKTLELDSHWTRGDDYNGIHLIFQHPNGTKVELQFHTPESLHAKRLTHPIYVEFRKPHTTAEQRLAMAIEMVDIADKAPVPPGIEGLGLKIFRKVG